MRPAGRTREPEKASRVVCHCVIRATCCKQRPSSGTERTSSTTTSAQVNAAVPVQDYTHNRAPDSWVADLSYHVISHGSSQKGQCPRQYTGHIVLYIRHALLAQQYSLLNAAVHLPEKATFQAASVKLQPLTFIAYIVAGQQRVCESAGQHHWQ